jgi:hypothetical protein
VKRNAAICAWLWAALVAPSWAQAPPSAPLAAPSLAPQAARGAASGIHPAVARIVAPGEGSVSYGSGTLVYAGQDFGLVITNWHVVNEATGPISVHFPDGFYSLGTVQQVDRDWDLAVIVVRRPNAEPVPLANEAPRPGEVLTIAGYGSGTYRAASGRCTQYVAPGQTFPFEMVEVAVSARQGDSGGPIFNEKGELAGVLFGEGHGRTSGSYCGRVRWFLTSVVRDFGSPQAAQIAEAPLTPVPARPVTSDEVQAPASVPLAPSNFARSTAAPTERVAFNAAPTAAVSAGPESVRVNVPTASLSWQDIAGETLGEQVKTVLAAIGILAIVLHALRWMSTEPAKA